MSCLQRFQKNFKDLLEAEEDKKRKRKPPHGMKNTSGSSGPLKKLFWTSVWLVLSAVFFVHLKSLIQIYLRFDVGTTVSLNYDMPTTFPAVSICNTNPLKKTAVMKNGQLSALIDSWKMGSLGRKRRSVETWYETIGDKPNEKADIADMSGLTGDRHDNQLMEDGSRESDSWVSERHRHKRSSPADTCASQACVLNNTCNNDTATDSCDAVDGCNLTNLCVIQDLDNVTGSGLTSCQCTTSLVEYNCSSTVANASNCVYGSTVAISQIVCDCVPDLTTALCQSAYIDECASSPCLNNGNCTDGNKTYTCACNTQYTGVRCETDLGACVYAPCLNGATCHNVNGNYTCSCSAGYTGDQCATDINECASSPCVGNHSLCTDRVNAYTCSCLAGFQGVNCSTAIVASVVSSSANSNLTERFKEEDDLMAFLQDLRDSEKRDLGYLLNDMLIDCKLLGKTCDFSENATFFDAVHGNCYVLNGGWANETNIVTMSRSGSTMALEMVLYVNQNEYLFGVERGAGMVVVLHDRNVMPFPEDLSIVVPPGFQTDLAITRTKATRMPSPYGDCVDAARDNSYRNVYEEIYPVKYTLLGCVKTCYQKYVMEECNCSDPQYPNYGLAFHYQNVSACRVRNNTHADCMYGVQLRYLANTLACDCPQACTDVSFSSVVTKAKWPSQKYYKSLVSAIEPRILETLSNGTMFTNYYKRNIVKVRIFYKTLSYRKIEQFPQYPLTKFVSDTGAILTFYLGCSLISSFEYVEMVLSICHAVYLTAMPRTAKVHDSKPKPPARTAGISFHPQGMANVPRNGLPKRDHRLVKKRCLVEGKSPKKAA